MSLVQRIRVHCQHVRKVRFAALFVHRFCGVLGKSERFVVQELWNRFLRRRKMTEKRRGEKRSLGFFPDLNPPKTVPFVRMLQRGSPVKYRVYVPR